MKISTYGRSDRKDTVLKVFEQTFFYHHARPEFVLISFVSIYVLQLGFHYLFEFSVSPVPMHEPSTSENVFDNLD